MEDLEAWLAQEREVNERIRSGAGFGVAPPAVAGMSGLEALQAALRGEIPASPITQVLDFQFIEVEAGRALFQGAPRPEYCNPMGTIHGGWYAAILDSCLVAAVYSMLPAGRAYTTAALSLNYVKAMQPKVQRVRAEGKVVHCGRQLATAEARLYDVNGTLYAHGSTTCMLFDVRAAG
jgi:uncharacterized protein (TIGR00369 family)